LDVDIGADAVDYKYASPLLRTTFFFSFLTSFCVHFSSAIANQESLSGLETEMRKLEGIVKEIVDEMDYLKRREERFQDTNGKY
jgi:p24 family protein delta-1